ncbi:MAG: hypothetical protein O3A00_03305 [Planctomycetota bacterium]|nr:hypothetical protein [Planctomycetota bacterium]
MDSQKALEQLEAVRPSSDDLSDPEFAEAAALLDSSADISGEFNRRQQWDASIGIAMRDVAVPNAARARLLNRLDPKHVQPTDAASKTATAVEPSTLAIGRSRRRWLVAASASLAATLLACLIWLMQPQAVASMSLADLLDQIPVDANALAQLPDADPASTQDIPKWQHILTQPKVVSLSLGNSATLYSFRVRGRHFSVIEGVVAVIGSDAISDPPAIDSFGMSETVYVTRGTKQYATVSWTQGGLTYICFFAPAGSRHEFESVLSGEPV